MGNPAQPNAVAAGTEGLYSGGRRAISLGLLLAMNVVPLLGVLFWGWDAKALVVLYWSENLVLGFFTIARMLTKSPLGGLGMSAFFCVHYGAFCAVHGLFILSLLFDVDADPAAGEAWPFFLVFLQLLVNVVREMLAIAPNAWLVAFLGLVISHGASFITNFLLGGERERVSLGQLMSAPYARIVIMQLTIILGGMGAVALGQPVFLVLLLVGIKTAIDVRFHLREHRKLAAKPPSSVLIRDR